MPAAVLGLPGCGGGPSPEEAPVDVTQDGETVEARSRECPDGLLFHAGFSLCVPPLPQCDVSWELPLTDGSCGLVGPRACTANWSPDQETTCDPTELLDCPEGFGLTADESACIPAFAEDCPEDQLEVLGGGCESVGPDFEGAPAPWFDHCDDGLLALPGAGCAHLGPTACPALWDPTDATDCEAGDKLPCPEGHEEDPAGFHCEPIYDDCPPGERPLTGGGCLPVVLPPEDCPSGPFPEGPGEAETVLYVLAGSGCQDECGSAEAPFPSLSQATESAPDGAHVLIGPGTYEEGLHLTRSVHLVGLCPAEVFLNGAIEVDDVGKFEAAAVVATGAAQISLSGLRISSKGAGVAFYDVAHYSLHDLEIAEATGAAAYFHKSDGEGQRLWVHDTGAGTGSGKDGLGIWLEKGSALELKESLLENNRSVGAHADGYGAQLRLQDCTVRDTQMNAAEVGGYGVRSNTHAELHLTRVLLERNHSRGIYAYGQSALWMEDSVIRDTLPEVNQSGSQSFGWGIHVKGSSTAELTRTVLARNTGIAFMATSSGTTVTLRQVAIRDTAPYANGKFGRGLEVNQGALLEMTGGAILRSKGHGAVALDEGSEALFRGTVVFQTDVEPGTALGRGVEAAKKGRINLYRCLLENSGTSGAVSLDIGALVELEECNIRGTRTDPIEHFGVGFMVAKGAVGTAQRSLFEQNRYGSLLCTNDGAHMDLEDCVLRDGVVSPIEEAGVGGFILYSGTAQMTRVAVENNIGLGLLVFGEAASVTMESGIVRDSYPASPNNGGYGIQVEEGAAFEMTSSLIDGNVETGLLVGGADASAIISGSAIRNTAADAAGTTGAGLQVVENARAELSRSLLHGNALAAIQVLGAPGHSRLDIDQSVVRHTQPNQAGMFGWGLRFEDGELNVESSLFEGNGSVGIALLEEGASGVVSRSVIRGTLPAPPFHAAAGIEVAGGASCLVEACLLMGNSQGGIVVAEPASKAEIRGTLVMDSLPGVDAVDGAGIVVVEGGNARVDWTLLSGNATSGVQSFHHNSSVEVTRSAIVATRPGGSWLERDARLQIMPAGDGLLVADGGTAHLSQSSITGSHRCGVYFGDGSGTLEYSVIHANDAFGLALADENELVSHQDLGNHIFGNGLAIGGDGDWNITTNPEGLPVPSPPKVATPPPTE